MEILTASTNVRRNGNGCAVERRGFNLPFNYEIAFRNCRVIIADYYEDIKFCNPAGYTHASREAKRNGADNKIRRLKA